eukprot:TRINITY_DN4813_c0_g1_i3.p1 TRINITY_DN4813_c0_g1~~TRINITY_DN4813_c0_g1_i3.p1  ORF type:complete len:405 (-),score=92.15 TRINITY_DN4813_c0_g1_i3:130-1344(-)
MSVAASRSRGGAMSKVAAQGPSGDRAIIAQLDQLRQNVCENLFHFRGNSKALVKSYNELRKAVDAEKKFLSLNPLGKIFLMNMRIFYEGLDERIEEALALDELCMDIQKGFQHLQKCEAAHRANKEDIATKKLAEAETIGDRIQSGAYADNPESIQYFNKLNQVAAEVIGRTPRTARDLNLQPVGESKPHEDSPARRYMADRDQRREQQHQELKVQTQQRQKDRLSSSKGASGTPKRTPSKDKPVRSPATHTPPPKRTTTSGSASKTSSSTGGGNPLRKRAEVSRKSTPTKSRSSASSKPVVKKSANKVSSRPPPPPSESSSGSRSDSDSSRSGKRSQRNSRSRSPSPPSSAASSPRSSRRGKSRHSSRRRASSSGSRGGRGGRSDSSQEAYTSGEFDSDRSDS